MSALITRKGNMVEITAAAQKYLAAIKTGKISEKELTGMKNFINKSEGQREVIFAAIQDKILKLDNSQNAKGIAFLLKVRRSKNTPFASREIWTLENFDRFTLLYFYDVAKYGQPKYFTPVFRCEAKDGSAFDYYYNAGEVSIIG